MKTSGSSMLLARKVAWGVAVLLGLLSPMTSHSQPQPDVGLLSRHTGKVLYWNELEGRKPVPVESFTKFRRGDHFQVPTGCTLQLLYFSNGRQEIWKGPVTLRAGESNSQALEERTSAAPPEIKFLPAKVTRKMLQTPLALPPASIRFSGVVQTMYGLKKARSVEGQRELQEAEVNYRQWRHQALTDDLSPEIYWLGVLADYEQYQEMNKVLEGMLLKKPEDQTLKQLKTWVRSISAASKLQQ